MAPANVVLETSWTRDILIFDNAPLSAVVAELNRYSPKKLVIVDGCAEGGCEGEGGMGARSAHGADEGQGASLLDQVLHVLAVPVGFTARYKFAKVPNDVPGAEGLLGGLLQRASQGLSLSAWKAGRDLGTSLNVVRYCGERLIELVCQGGRHFPEFVEA